MQLPARPDADTPPYVPSGTAAIQPDLIEQFDWEANRLRDQAMDAIRTLADLAKDIKVNGLVHPIVIDAAGVLIDGRGRVPDRRGRAAVSAAERA